MVPPQPRSLFWIALSNLASKSHGDAGLTYSLGFGFVIVGVGLWKGSFAKAVISTLSLALTAGAEALASALSSYD